MTFIKNRLERDQYDASFIDRLNDGETITDTSVTVLYAVDGGPVWQDVTSDILGAVSTNGPDVQFTLIEALTDAVQRPGAYRIVAKVTTSSSRILVGEMALAVTA